MPTANAKTWFDEPIQRKRQLLLQFAILMGKLRLSRESSHDMWKSLISLHYYRIY